MDVLAHYFLLGKIERINGLKVKDIPMKKLQEIVISGASGFIYDILHKTIEIVKGRDAVILEIGQSEARDKNGNSVILVTMIFEAGNGFH